MLEIKELTKCYPGNRGLFGLNLTLKAGEVVALLGPNGAGKTTALKTMMGFTQATSGTATWKGIPISEQPENTRHQIGMMIGDPAPYPYLTGLQYLKLYQKQYSGITDQDIQEILETVGLENRKNDKIRTYSTGMKQRICLAKVLLHKPELILLDEPFSGMDIEGRNALSQMLKKIVDERKISLIISSHLIHDIEGMTTKVCIISDSQWLLTESTSQIKGRFPTIEAFYLNTVGTKRSIAI